MRRIIAAVLLSMVLLLPLPLASVDSIAAPRSAQDCPLGFVGPVSPVDQPDLVVRFKETPHGLLVVSAPLPLPSTLVVPVQLVVP